jgi:hypothetical protein
MARSKRTKKAGYILLGAKEQAVFSVCSDVTGKKHLTVFNN